MKYIKCHKCNSNGAESYPCICGVPEEQLYPHGSIMQDRIDTLTKERDDYKHNLQEALKDVDLACETRDEALKESSDAIMQLVKVGCDLVDSQNEALQLREALWKNQRGLKAINDWLNGDAKVPDFFRCMRASNVGEQLYLDNEQALAATPTTLAIQKVLDAAKQQSEFKGELDPHSFYHTDYYHELCEATNKAVKEAGL